jgi:hypothetical protein
VKLTGKGDLPGIAQRLVDDDQFPLVFSSSLHIGIEQFKPIHSASGRDVNV